MNSQLELYDVSALGALQTAISRFQSEIEQALETVRAEIARAEDFLAVAIEDRRYQLEQAQSDVAEGEAALVACQNSGCYDELGNYWPPDCSYEETALQQAYRRVVWCEDRLQAAYRWKERLSAAESECTRETAGLADLAGEPSVRARSELGALAMRYTAVHAGSMTAGLPPAGSPAPAVGPAGSPGLIASKAWIERAVQPVALAELPEISDIAGPGDFHKVSEDEMRAGIARLQEMLPVITSGVGASKDYWADYDRQRGLTYAKGYQRIYDAFYGQDAIRVEKDGNRYDVINGRHRIWLARRMGVIRLPVRVVERT